MKINVNKDRVGLWVLCEAIGDQRDLIDMVDFDENGLIEVKLMLGDVELDFSNVAKRIDEIFNQAVTKKAQELLNEKYDSLISSISDIQERIDGQREHFLYDWERESED